MSYKTILLHLDEHPRRSERTEIAVRLAEAFDGQLVGAFAAQTAFIPSPALAEVGPEMLEIEQRNRRVALSSAEADFSELARRGGIRYAWRDAVGAAGFESLLAAARCADLIVAGQPEPDDANHRAFIGEMLLSVGRPVLLVPYVGRYPKVGQRVFVAWNGSREAARAVGDALPFLSRAAAVEVVEFDTQSGRGKVDPADADVGAYLARHGVKVTVSRHHVPDLAIGEQILSRAADHSADLIVMGAYGHSRMRELILGGATRTLLESMTVPVLLSH